MNLLELSAHLASILEHDPAVEPARPDVGNYEVQYRVPSGGNWSGMDAPIDLVRVNHSTREIILGAS